MKIVYLCESIDNIAGIERIVLTKANYFADILNYNVFIITTFNKKNQSFYSMSEKIKLINLGSNLNSLKGFVDYKKKINEILKNINPDVVFVPTGKEGFVFPFIEKKYYKVREIHFNKKSRQIQNQESSLYRKACTYIIDKLEEISIKKYDKLVVLTKEDKLNWKNSKVEVIPNAKTLESKEVASLVNKKAIAIGRLDYQKGFDRLIKAWALLNNKEWILEIYGDGPLKNELQELINRLKLEKNIFLRGTTKEIKEKLLASSIYILSSRHEGLPLVLLEAMECGLPIISFDCPCGPKDVIRNDYNGYLIKDGDIEGLSLNLSELILNDEKRKEMGKNAKKYVQNYSVLTIMTKWKEIIENEYKRKK